MSMASQLNKAGAKTPQSRKRTSPLWKGPEEDGITFSLLCRFLCCRERFRLYVVEGLKPTDAFNHKIEYGNMWHVCEESFAKVGNLTTVTKPGQLAPWQVNLVAYCTNLCRKYPTQQEQIDHWFNVCRVQFPEYITYWAKNKDVVERTPLLQEYVFNVPYRLSSGRTVKLRGKWDSVDLIGTGKSAGIYLQENKTKGDIKELQMKRQLSFDLQTMLYLVALYEQKMVRDKELKGKSIRGIPLKTDPILGVRYNIIRRPLSGGTGTIRQHKPSKSNPQGEGKAEFYNRLLNDYIKADPKSYFMRWKVEISPADVEKFRRECLDPTLESLCDWWNWITYSQDPFEINSVVELVGKPTPPCSIHWRHPYGVYNVLDEGGSSDLDEYLSTGSDVGLQRVEQLFGELQP